MLLLASEIKDAVVWIQLFGERLDALASAPVGQQYEGLRRRSGQEARIPATDSPVPPAAEELLHASLLTGKKWGETLRWLAPVATAQGLPSPQPVEPRRLLKSEQWSQGVTHQGGPGLSKLGVGAEGGFRLMAQRVVISGASRGIGAALAEAMAEPGVALLLLARNEENLHRVAARCRAKGAQVCWMALDVRHRVAVVDAVKTFAQAGGVQLLIANAGTVSLERTPTDRGPDWERLQDQIHHNLSCTLSLLQAGLSLPEDHRLRLHCVVVSSLNAFLALGEAPGYCVAKAAQRSLVEALEDFYACRPAPATDVFFSQVFPGFVATAMAEGYPGPRPLECSAEQAAQRILRGVRARRRIILFPRRLALLLWLGQRLPKPVLRWMMAPSRAYRGSWP